MAKQQSNIGADTALVKGAGAMYASGIPQYNFSDIEKSLSSLASIAGKISEKRQQEIDEKNQRAYNATKLLDGMSEYDPESTKLPENYEKAVTAKLFELREQAQNLVGDIATLEGSEKAEAEIQLNKIKKTMGTIVDNAKYFDLNSRETLEDIRQGNYSEGADRGKLTLQQAIAGGEDDLKIDEQGNFYFDIAQQTAEGIKTTRQNLPDLFSPEALPKPAGNIAELLMTEVTNAGKLGGAGNFNEAQQQSLMIKIDNATKELTQEQALSLAVDNFGGNISGPFANLSTEDMRQMQAKNPAQFKNMVIDQYKKMAIDLGTTTQNEYDEKQQSQVNTKQWQIKLQSDAALYSDITDFAKSGRSAQPAQIIQMANQLTKDGTFTTGYELTRRLLTQEKEGEEPTQKEIEAALKTYGIKANSLYKGNDNTKEYPITPEYLQSTLLEIAGLSPRRQQEIKLAYGLQTTPINAQSLIAKYSK